VTVRRWSLGLQIFLSVLLVALGGVVAVGLVAREALSRAFDAYLAGLPAPGGGMGGGPHLGRVMLGAAEQTFVASVDGSVFIGGAGVVVVAVVVALLLARYLNRPIRELENAAEELAGGDLARRVQTAGPIEVARLGEAFNHMADSLEQAEELRRRMVADVSHELRNPLAAARAQAEGMAEGVLSANPDRLESLADDLRHLSALVEDLQVLAVADAGRLHYNFATMDLGELARAEVKRAQASSPEGVEVIVTAAGSFDVIGDELRLSQVVRNLLSNALRHTPRGVVDVTVRRGSDSWMELRVRDTGQGIPAQDLPHVFERFYRADTARAADTGGAGLGLAIAHRIVTDHGGTTFAENNADEGATVGFRLPPIA
jgi:two-component system, OmpR family, sensor histidine kinase BaeS